MEKETSFCGSEEKRIRKIFEKGIISFCRGEETIEIEKDFWRRRLYFLKEKENIWRRKYISCREENGGENEENIVRWKIYF